MNSQYNNKNNVVFGIDSAKIVASLEDIVNAKHNIII